PCISADGRYVAFSSWASNLVIGDTNGVVDVFIRDRQSGTTERVSVDSSGGELVGPTYLTWITPDGRYLGFITTNDFNVIDPEDNYDAFIHDRQSGMTEQASVTASGGQGSHDSTWPSISADGRYVAFNSLSHNLVTGDTNGREDVFVRDRVAG